MQFRLQNSCHVETNLPGIDSTPMLFVQIHGDIKISKAFVCHNKVGMIFQLFYANICMYDFTSMFTDQVVS